MQMRDQARSTGSRRSSNIFTAGNRRAISPAASPSILQYCGVISPDRRFALEAEQGRIEIEVSRLAQSLARQRQEPGSAGVERGAVHETLIEGPPAACGHLRGSLPAGA
jgi:hypothetical protein